MEEHTKQVTSEDIYKKSNFTLEYFIQNIADEDAINFNNIEEKIEH